MSRNGPVIIIEDDAEDHEFILEAYNETQLKNKLQFFTSAQEAYDYLLHTTEKPFIIISEINLRGMDGITFRKKIMANEQIRKKSIPFVYLTAHHDRKDVEAAYDLEVQGYFIKKYSIADIKRLLLKIYEYWSECFHPNNCI